MKRLFLKELREQMGVILMGIFIALAIISVFRIKNPEPFSSTSPIDLIPGLEHLFLVLIVVYSAAFSNAIAGDRDRGDQSFLAALPLHPLGIWFTKLIAAASAMGIVHLSIALIGSLFGYTDLLMFILVNRLPNLIAFCLLLTTGCTLLCGALFRRAFSVLTGGCMLTLILTFVSGYIRLFWQWHSMMLWPLATGCIAMTAVSAIAFRAELRGERFRRRQSLLSATAILLLMAAALTIQYTHETCRPPDPDKAELVAWIPGRDKLLMASSLEGPVFEFSPGHQKPRKISNRFESFDRDEISPDGRYIILYNNRGFLGSFDFSAMQALMNDDGLRDPARSISSWIWQDQQDESIAFGSSILILNTETGKRTELVEGEYGQPLRAVWYNRSGDLAVMFYQSASNGNPGRDSIALMTPEGRFIRYLAKPQQGGYLTVADDRSTMMYMTLHEAETGDHPRIETGFKTVIDTEWRRSDKIHIVPSVSPDHQWILEFQPESSGDRYTIQIRNLDGTVIHAGETRNAELVQWSPGSRLLVFSRERQPALNSIDPDPIDVPQGSIDEPPADPAVNIDDHSTVPVAETSDSYTGQTVNPTVEHSQSEGLGRRELVVFDSQTRILNSLPDDLSDVFDQQFASWSARVVFSPDETCFAVSGHSPVANIIVHTPQDTYLIGEGDLAGWIDNTRLLLRRQTAGTPERLELNTLDTVTREESDFSVPSLR